MSSGLYPMPTRTSSSCASAWSTPPRFTTSPRNGFQWSGLTTRPRPSSLLGPSRTFCWTWTSSSTWTDLMSSQFWAPGPGAWRRRSGPRTTLSVRRSRKRTWRRHLMPPSSPPLKTKLARPRRGGFLTGAPKLSPGAAGRSSSASSELLLTVNPVGWRKKLTYWSFSLSLDVTGPACGSLASFPCKVFCLFYCGMPNGAEETRHGQRHGQSERWKQTSAETAERILGRSQPGSYFTLHQIDFRTLYSNESLFHIKKKVCVCFHVYASLVRR